MPFNPFNLWRAGAVVLACFAVLFFFQARSARSERDKAREEVGALEMSLKISNKSIAELEREIGEMNEAALSRAAAYERAQKQAAQQAKRFEREKAVLAGKVERIEGLASESGCKANPDLLRELEGL